MGSSKKHKEKDREGKKKKKHRSRSRSRSRDRERKRKHRERERDRSRSPISGGRDRILASSVTTAGSGQGLSQVSSVDAEEEFLYGEESRHTNRDRGDRSDYNQPPSAPSENVQQTDSKEAPSGDGSSLSIEETNRLRAKLGLKPLDLPVSKAGEDGKIKTKDGVHAPPVNLAEKRKTERLKEKMANKKTQREIQSKLGKVKGLGDSDSDDAGATAWVTKSRKIQKEREMAEKRAKMLEEMDQDFGIGNLVEREFQKDTKKGYSAQDLSGLKVEHSLERFEEGRNVILTLKDRGILDEEEEGDVLVNVNIEDDERADKNVDNKKKKPDYKPYDEPEFDEYGMLKPSSMLEKYDEEIDGAKKESFTLGSAGHYDANHEKRMAEIRQQLRARGETLLGPAPTLATEYLTKEEVKNATFKKTKKKVRKIRKKEKVLKADDLLPLAEETAATQDYGSRSRGRGRVDVKEVKEEGEADDDDDEMAMNVDEPAFSTDMAQPPLPKAPAPIAPPLPMKNEPEDDDMIGPDEDLTGVDVEEEEAQNELQGMLAKARKINLKKERKLVTQTLAMAGPSGIKLEGAEDANIVLNSTSEFCRNLGEIPTYGLSGNREEERDELLDMELELMEQRRKEAEQEDTTGGWNEVDIDENPVDIKAEESAVLDDEPIATDGIGAALKLAMKKGYLEAEDSNKMPANSANALELQAQNYTIQDKRYDDLDEKNRKRDRYSGGMISEFKEKETYKPEVQLDYVDESGRCLSQKEAFRQLSHRFHGKGSGKKKTEKRGKKVEEELLMKRMSSTDTPLNTLSLLQDKQRSEQSPYIVLSGNKGFTSNSISKPS